MNTEFRNFIQYTSLIGEAKTWYPVLTERLGFVESILFVHILHSMKLDENEGWLERSFRDLHFATGLSYKQLKRAKRNLSLGGFLEVRRGQTERLYRISESAFEELSRVAHDSNNISDIDRENIYIRNGPKGTVGKQTKEATSTPEKKQEIEEEFDWDKYVKILQGDKKKYIRLIGNYFASRSLSFDTKEKAQAALKRHLRAAQKLEPFSGKDLKWAADYCKDKYSNIDWTLDTMLKVLTSAKRDN